ncbi:MAG: two-component system regulatory protein YycI [Enterococcus sp.]
MDFRKIEWIFFFVFIGLNIFLFSIFWSNQHEQSLVTNSNQREDIIHRLKNDDIELKEKISDEHREGYYLSAEQDDFQKLLSEPSNQTIAQTASVSDKILTYYPSQNREFNLKTTQKSFNQLMQENTVIMDGQQYSYLPDISKKEDELAKIVGAQSYEGIPFMDETSRVILDVEKSDGEVQVLKYTQTRLKEIEPLREKMALYSEKEILNTLYINNNIPAKSTITNVYLGYFRTLEVREKNVYVPVWFVKIRTADKTIQIEKVNALNNQVITNNLVPKVENP